MQVQKEEEKKTHINAVIHENDLCKHGTQKEIKPWAWLGNPWIHPGSNNGGGAEADSLIPEKEEDESGGVTAWRAAAPIAIGLDDMGRFAFLPHVAKRYSDDLQTPPMQNVTFWHFLSQLWSVP